MKWMNWLRSELLPDDAFYDATDTRGSAHDMDMKQVIDTLRMWVACLHDLVRHQAESDPDLPHKDPAPPVLLRRWLYGPAHKHYGELHEFQTLRHAYEKFHACSDAILQHYLDNFKDRALRLLEDELPIHSESFQVSIVRLYAAAAARR